MSYAQDLKPEERQACEYCRKMKYAVGGANKSCCQMCGEVDDGQKEFFMSQSLHIHTVAGLDGKAATLTIQWRLCKPCYAADMATVSGGDEPIGNYLNDAKHNA